MLTLTRRYAYRKGGSGSHFALDGNFALMQFHDLLGDAQAQPGTANLSRVARPVERFKQPGRSAPVYRFLHRGLQSRLVLSHG